MKCVLTLILSSVFSFSVMACSCAMTEGSLSDLVRQAHHQADVVVLARAERVEEQVPMEKKQQHQIRFQELQQTQFVSLKSWKGTFPARFYTRIETSCCVCGYKFKEGREYLLYLTGPDLQGMYQTNICSRTRVADIQATDEIKVLDQLFPSSHP